MFVFKESLNEKSAVNTCHYRSFFFAALNYHFILMDKNVKILKKVELTFNNTFVDARGAKKYKLFLNPSLVKAGIRKAFER